MKKQSDPIAAKDDVVDDDDDDDEIYSEKAANWAQAGKSLEDVENRLNLVVHHRIKFGKEQKWKSNGHHR